MRRRFEPQQSIPRKCVLQSVDDAERIVIARLLVVDDDQREQRVGLGRSVAGRGLLDEAQTAVAIAIDARDSGHQARPRRHPRDEVAVEADCQPGVGARGIDRQDALMFLVGAPCGAESCATGSRRSSPRGPTAGGTRRRFDTPFRRRRACRRGGLRQKAHQLAGAVRSPHSRARRSTDAREKAFGIHP